MPYRHIIVALAGQEEEAPLIDEAVRLAEAIGAALTVLHVNDPAAGQISMMMDPPHLTSEEGLRSMFRERGHDAMADAMRVEIRTDAAIPRAIAGATADADLLILGHRRRSRFLAALTAAADKHLSDQVDCPVLIVPLG